MLKLIAAIFAGVVIAACTAETPVPTPSVTPAAVPSVGSDSWAYAGAILRPVDPNAQANRIVDAVPLRDGGWVVLRAHPVVRSLADPSSSQLIKEPTSTLERLDASGRVVAVEHGTEPFGLRRIAVFESAGVVVGEGHQVRNGTAHAFRLDTLDGLASELTSCIAVGERCWSYRTARVYGSTALEERDPRTFAVVRSFPNLTMDGLTYPPSIFPELNLFAWVPDGRGVRAAALDLAAPIRIGWLDRLRDGCSVSRVGADRALVIFGPPGCDGETGWHSELTEVSTGRVVRRFGADEAFGYVGYREIIVRGDGQTFDPRDGREGPIFGSEILWLDFGQGLAVATLADGGAAIWRRQAAPARPEAVPFSRIAAAMCPVDFPRVQIAGANPPCPALASSGGPHRLFVTTGRGFRGPVGFDVDRITADPALRTIEIHYVPSSTERHLTLAAAPAVVVDLGPPLTGEWLVRLLPWPAPPNAAEFVVTLP